MIVRTLQALHTDRWCPPGTVIEIPFDHFDPALHALVEAPVEAAAEPTTGEEAE